MKLSRESHCSCSPIAAGSLESRRLRARQVFSSSSLSQGTPRSVDRVGSPMGASVGGSRHHLNIHASATVAPRHEHSSHPDTRRSLMSELKIAVILGSTR